MNVEDWKLGREKTRSIVAASLAMVVAGCGSNLDIDATIDTPEHMETVQANSVDLTYEDFVQQYVYKEPWEGGVFIYDGDTPVANEKQLFELYQKLVSPPSLIVNTIGGSDDKWSASQAVNLTYCISNSFTTSQKNAVISAMQTALEGGWETFANVNLTYDSSQDSSCTASNNNVTFDVRPVSGQSYLARAFFPSYSRSQRNILIDTSAFSTSWPLSGILGHELGHVLGFRHEHTRPEAGTCFEDNSWRALTPYDSASIMHYPQCNGSANTLAFTTRDAQGAAALYGAPGNPPPPPPPPPGGGNEQTATASGTVRRNRWVYYSPITVDSGTNFRVVMTGTNDADLYVRFGAQPTTTTYNCRPYLTGSNETCDLTVPAGQTQAYIGVRGYSSATSSYNLTVTWTGP